VRVDQQNRAKTYHRSRARGRSVARADGLLTAAELTVALLIIAAANLPGFTSFNETLVLLPLGWVSLNWRGPGWRAAGLKRPAHWGRTLASGVAVGVACQFSGFLLFLIVPLTGRHIDLSRFAPVEGNVLLLLLSLIKVWTLTAFGEELVYRGYLMNRVAELAGGGAAAWAGSLVVVSILFGVGHSYQGVTGVIAAALGGLVYGALYLWSGRNLWAPIIAHGVFDTLAFVLIFWGKYPGLR
jgi:uncharacterized protein